MMKAGPGCKVGQHIYVILRQTEGMADNKVKISKEWMTHDSNSFEQDNETNG
jgi:hypothetical protein